MKLTNGIPTGDIASPNVGGTNEAANNKFKTGTIPSAGMEGNVGNATNMAASSKVPVNDSAKKTKETVIGGVYMGK